MNKETNPFKFNDYHWKLVAKMEENSLNSIKKKKMLRIYLRLEKGVEKSLEEDNDSSS